MKAKGISLKIKQKPKDTVKNGIIIPSTAENPLFVWGDILEVGEAVAEDISVGDEAYYASGDSYKAVEGTFSRETGEQLVSIKNILFWR